MRSTGFDLGRTLTFGGRMPATIGAILLAMAVPSLAALGARWLIGLLAFSPYEILAGQVWRLATWFTVQDPISLLFAGRWLWWIGQTLSYEWSERTFLVRFAVLVIGSAVLGTLLSLVWPGVAAHAGVWPIANALLLEWALLHPGAELNWFGVLPMSGRTVAIVVVIGTVLYAMFAGGPGRFVLHFAALAIAWLQLNVRGGPRRSWLRAKQRWYEWQLRRRARHLKVVGRNGQGGPSRWKH